MGQWQNCAFVALTVIGYCHGFAPYSLFTALHTQNDTLNLSNIIIAERASSVNPFINKNMNLTNKSPQQVIDKPPSRAL